MDSTCLAFKLKGNHIYDSYYNTVLCYDVLYGTYRWDTIQTIADSAFYYIY